MFSHNTEKRACTRLFSAIWSHTIYALCSATILCTPYTVHPAGATIPDWFIEAPGTKAKGSIFATPEILVVFYPPGIGYGSHEALIVERWEYMRRRLGYVAGYVQRGGDNRLQMCACTKWTRILDDSLARELEVKRTEQEEEITNFEDLSLDDRVKQACEYMNTWKGCVDIDFTTPTVPRFCNVLMKKSQIQVVPMEFSRQSYLMPGLRLITENRGGDKTQDLYLGASSNWESASKRSRDTKTVECEDIAGRAFDTSVTCKTPTTADLPDPDEDELASGYLVSRSGEEVCIEYISSTGRATDCVPAPSLQRPIITAASGGGNKLQIEFDPCKNNDGEDTNYCKLIMGPGDKDAEIGFFVAQPKFDANSYDFIPKYVCDEPGVAIGSCKSPRQAYAEDPQGNVICVMNLQFAQKKFHVKRNHRNYWISELPKVLVGRSWDSKSKKNILCSDGKSLDLSKMRQKDIDRFRSRGRFFRIMPQENSGTEGDTLCKDNMLYSYENDRVFEHEKPHLCSSDSRNGVIGGHCKTRYISEDYHQPFFLKDEEDSNPSAVVPLNPLMQGMCISNFPEHSYKYYTGDSSLTSGLSTEESNQHLLEVNKDNTTCDFIRMEMWGGGESGSLLGGTKAGKPGEYVMGVLKVNPAERKYLIVSVGHGGVASLDSKGNSNAKSPGGNTSVALCDDMGGKRCSLRLIAKGGGQPGVSSTGYTQLTHYRVAEGRSEIRDDEVFVPYQDINFATGRASVGDVGCASNAPNAADGSAIRVIAPGKYIGAGGCARADIKVLQSGAHGMAKLTCEKWSGTPGKVKEWEGSFCSKEVFASLNVFKKHAIDSKLDQKTNDFFSDIASAPFCRGVTGLPKFPQTADSLALVVKSKNVVKKNRKAAKKWIEETLAELNSVLSSDHRIIDAYVKAQKAFKRTNTGGKTEFTQSFEKLISNKVDIIADSGEVFAMLERLKEYAEDLDLDTKSSHILAALGSKAFAEDVAKSPDFVEWLESAVATMDNLQDSVLDNREQLAENTIIEPLKRILASDSVTLQAYKKVIDALGESVDESELATNFVHGLRELIHGVFFAALDTVTDLLAQLKKYAVDNNIKVLGVLRRMTVGNLPGLISKDRKLIASLKAIMDVLGSESKSFGNRNDADAWVESTITPLVQALGKNNKIAQAYDKVRYDADRPKWQYDDDAESELITNFRRLVDSKAVISKSTNNETVKQLVVEECAWDTSSESIVQAIIELKSLATSNNLKCVPQTFHGISQRHMVNGIKRDPKFCGILKQTARIAKIRDPNMSEFLGPDELSAFRSVGSNIVRQYISKPDALSYMMIIYSTAAQLCQENIKYMNAETFSKATEVFVSAFNRMWENGLITHNVNVTRATREYGLFFSAFQALLKRTGILDEIVHGHPSAQILGKMFGNNNLKQSAARRSWCLHVGLNSILLTMNGLLVARNSIPDFDRTYAFAKQMLSKSAHRYVKRCVTASDIYDIYSQADRESIEHVVEQLVNRGHDSNNVSDQEFLKALEQIQALTPKCPEGNVGGICCGVSVVSDPEFVKVANQRLRGTVRGIASLLQELGNIRAASKGYADTYINDIREVLIKAFNSDPNHKSVYQKLTKRRGGVCSAYLKPDQDDGQSLVAQVGSALDSKYSPLWSKSRQDGVRERKVVNKMLGYTAGLQDHRIHLVSRIMAVPGLFQPGTKIPLFSFLSDHLIPILDGEVQTFYTNAEAKAWIEKIEAHMEEFSKDPESLGLLAYYGNIYFNELLKLENMISPFKPQGDYWWMKKEGPEVTFVKKQSKNSGALYLDMQLNPPPVDDVAHPLSNRIIIYDHSALTRAVELAGKGVPYVPMVEFYRCVRELLKSKVRVVK
ncbi:hypothetical protein OC188_03625 [Anaplasma capra]|uniref:glycine-rich domain-containing protein n=1 Tax=Anaplasma capra TaxID=1562740 RepID=UPI0021D56A1A|nr:hypothetical protein [Anaplasma capra]MCU7611778.1 hypothetical protein [Anaplasma capra]